MRFSCARDTLLRLVSSVASASDSRATIPILGCVLMSCRDGILTMMASDMVIQKLSRAGVHDVPNFSVAVPAQKLKALLSSLPSGTHLTAEVQDGKLALASSTGRFSLATMPASEFPEFPPLGDFVDHITLPVGILRQHLQQVISCIAVNDVRFTLCGAYITAVNTPDGLEITCVGSDGHRLAQSVSVVPGAEIEADRMSGIIPRETVLDMIKCLSGMHDSLPVELALSTHAVTLSVNAIEFEMKSKLLDGAYPDWRKVMTVPGGRYKLTVTASVPLLSQALARVCLAVDDRFKPISARFWSELGADYIDLEAKSDHTDGKEVVPVEGRVSMSEITWGVNGHYFQDAVRMFGDVVDIHINDASEKALFRVGQPDRQEMTKTPDLSIIVMPVRM